MFADILDEIFIFLLRKKEYFKLGITFAMVIFFTLGLTIPHISPYGWPLGLDIGFVAAGFMLLGMNIRHFFDKLMLSDILIVIGILAINILILFILRTLVSVPNVYMYDGNYGNIPAFLAYVFTHSTAVLIISVLIGMKGSPFNKYLVYMGMNTLGIFEIHKPIVRFISSHIVERGYSVENPIIVIVIALIGIVVSLFINKIIITIIPELPGRND